MTRNRPTHIALLRGINVGGRNKLPMKDLAAMFEAAGAADVRTYIQSGNVLFRATAALAKKIPAAVTKSIAKDFGYDIPVVLRSAAQWKKIAAGNPFLDDGVDEKALAVLCLADKPTKARPDSLDPDRSPGDSFVTQGSDIYLYLPNGVARTKLTNDYFDRTLSSVSTVRNWKTTLKLLEMLEG